MSAFAYDDVLSLWRYPPLEGLHMVILGFLTFAEECLEKKHSYDLKAVALCDYSKIVFEYVLLCAVGLNLYLGATMWANGLFEFLSLPLMPTLQTGVLTFGVALCNMWHSHYCFIVLVSAEWWKQLDAPCHCLLQSCFRFHIPKNQRVIVRVAWLPLPLAWVQSWVYVDAPFLHASTADVLFPWLLQSLPR